MSKTQPIKDLKEINKLKNYFLEKKEIRNYVLVTLGFNTALRISDLLNIKWNDVYDFESKKFKKHMFLVEQKTDKQNTLILNETVISALKDLKKILSNINCQDYIIKSRQGINKPISRNRAFNIIRGAARAIGIEGNISCHSLRKTFGYQAWKKGVPSALIMSIYNHSSMEVTKMYLSIDQDDKDEVFMNINL